MGCLTHPRTNSGGEPPCLSPWKNGSRFEIAGKYHQRIHASLLRHPLGGWRGLQGEIDFDLPPDRMAFWTSFLPGDRRRLLKDGIHLEKIRYWSDALSRNVGRGAELEIKYDPRDLSRIFVRQADGRFVEARYRNLAYPPVSWWEWKHAKKKLRDLGKRELHEEIIFASIAQQRQIEDFAANASATARGMSCVDHSTDDRTRWSGHRIDRRSRSF